MYYFKTIQGKMLKTVFFDYCDKNFQGSIFSNFIIRVSFKCNGDICLDIKDFDSFRSKNCFNKSKEQMIEVISKKIKNRELLFFQADENHLIIDIVDIHDNSIYQKHTYTRTNNYSNNNVTTVSALMH